MATTASKGRPALAAAATPIQITQRVFLAVVAGYFFAAETTGLSGLLLSHLIPRNDAGALAAMLAYVVYLIVILWAFADRNLKRLWIVIPGAAISCYFISTQLLAGGSA